MKRFAVIGFTSLKDFRFWAQQRIKDTNDYSVGKDYLIDNDNDIAYHCITCVEDIGERLFDEILDCNPLRAKLKERMYPTILGDSERDIFAQKVAEIIADYVETTDSPCKLSKHSDDGDEMLYFTHNYAIGEQLFDKGLRFMEDKNGKD